MESRFLRKQTSRRDIVRGSVTLAVSAFGPRLSCDVARVSAAAPTSAVGGGARGPITSGSPLELGGLAEELQR
jgi:hypothetical protein